MWSCDILAHESSGGKNDNNGSNLSLIHGADENEKVD
jgi:hypothetical protein